MACDSCNMISIQGVPCHEIGCPDAWRETLVECSECGFDFHREGRYQTTCPDCVDDGERHWSYGMDEIDE